MEETSFAFLRELLDNPGPSGFEERPSAVWRNRAESFADEVTRDVLGNSYARLENPGRRVVVIEGHIDEIGLMVTHIDEQGYLWFDQLGGWDVQVLIGQRVLVLGNNGDVPGVVGRKAAHVLSADDRNKVPQLRELWIDVGSANREEASARIEPGDPIVLDAGFRQLMGDRVVSRSLDNRVGAFVALEALRHLAENRPNLDVFALAATREEINFAGAFAATFQLKPDVAIVIDVAHSTDYPSASKERDGDVKIGSGPVLSAGPTLNMPAYRMIRRVAEREGISCQLQGAAGTSGTDADAMVLTGAGTATVLVSIPNRYMHSPNELVSLNDLEQAAKLIAAFVASIEEDTDFRP